ncbi:hypothetical protein IRY55_01230 [Savagea sp. SN6]|uniref:Uncharacterized protein n=1 Tax=Savagea serpentis TaxID=2785297 RepID=A0A8J7G6D6_9BACL|nr:hypothetical protein [Savagea serpentis]MBF4499968.1 hypothetical protein [Savagea serpentis]
MITTIIILFLLQFLTLAALVILYLRLQKNERLYEEQSELVEQFELSMQVYLDEIKKENEQLLERLTERSSKEMAERVTSESQRVQTPLIEEEFVATPPTYASHLQARLIQEQRKKLVAIENPEESARVVKPQLNRAEQQERLDQSMQTQAERIEEESYEAQVKRLYDEGESIEALAKRFNCGTTEIELLLKFHR